MRTHNQLDVKARCREAIAPLMERHCLGVPTQIVTDTEGWVNPCFFVDDTYVVRFNARDTEIPKFAREVVAMGRLAEAGLPVPAVVCLDESCSVAPFDVLITQWMAGTNLDLLWPTLDDDARVSLASQAGEALARLHQLEFPRYGEVIGHWGSQSAAWSEHVRSILQTELALAERLGVFDEAQRRGFAQMAADPRWALDAAGAPRLVHYDFHPGNLMVRDGQLVGILDFEWCMAGDPVADFTVEPHLKKTWPGSHGPFIAGYEGVAGPIHRHRLGLYQLVRNVTLCNVAAQHFSEKERGEYCDVTLQQLQSLNEAED